ncbi:MAG: DUF4342 domain-containing protein [Candidatus Bathyarchaeia archaeon]|nr:DUF4342 domain-containing protein [Candidatus Bathyarchaeota archaeon]
MSCPKCGKELPEDAKFCPQCGARIETTRVEEFQISADDLIKRVKELIHEGNIRRIVVRNEAGETLLEIPVTVGLLGALLAPYLAALGVIAAMVTRCKIAVERKG